MLTALVVVETIVLALLSVIVVALLRSHAEVLRRIPEPQGDHANEDPAGTVVLPDAPTIPEHLPSPRRRATEAHDNGNGSSSGCAK